MYIITEGVRRSLAIIVVPTVGVGELLHSQAPIQEKTNIFLKIGIVMFVGEQFS